MATQITVLLLESFELVLGQGVFTVFGLHNMNVPLFWKELTRVTDLGSRWSVSCHMAVACDSPT
eukprot:1154001-Pelagomonas_calceolata.AAC.1